MADIFISYKHEDRAIAERFARELKALDFTVWWDDAITPRRAWDEIIEQEIAAAGCVLVLWTERAIASQWVRAEAHYGQDKSKLVPVIVESCTPPLAFSLNQTLDLSRWNGSKDDSVWQKLVIWLGDLRSAPPEGEPQTSRPNPFRTIIAHLNDEPVYDAKAISVASPAGTLFADMADGPVMRVLPKGTLTIGALAFDNDRAPCEGPCKQIALERPLAFSVYQVTEDLVARFGLAARAQAPIAPPSRNFWQFKRSAAPIAEKPSQRDAHVAATHVNFNDAQQLAARLSSETGARYRLPSEAEWEYACRAGTRTRFCNGDGICETDAAFFSGDQTLSGPQPPGQFKPNRFGLYDMHGNVREWTLDTWQDNYDFTPLDGSPAFDSRSAMRVVRGGSWSDPAVMLRSSARSRATESMRSPDIGIRLVRELDSWSA